MEFLFSRTDLLTVGNESIQCFDGPRTSSPRKKVPSPEALRAHEIEPITLASKEPLGIVNGTAFSAAVAALAIDDAMHLALLAQVCTAMSTEALIGARGNYAAFIHETARPHPGQVRTSFNKYSYSYFDNTSQVESAQNIWYLLEDSKFARLHEEEIGLKEDKYNLRQDRYSLRTAPQFIGPQIEDILSALTAITRECNSSMRSFLIPSFTVLTNLASNG